VTYKFEQVKILVVDDMNPMLSIVKSVLSIFGFRTIFLAENGEEAFEIICKENPDLIITDWMMKPMNGLELVKKIRTDKRVPNPYLPILMMTGYSSRLRVENARDIGVTEFLVKPFSAQDLYTRVANIIEKPRQFVDTGNFFGPDRRRRVGEDYKGPMKRGEDENKFYVDLSPEQQEQADSILKDLQDDAKKLQD